MPTSSLVSQFALVCSWLAQLTAVKHSVNSHQVSSVETAWGNHLLRVRKLRGFILVDFYPEGAIHVHENVVLWNEHSHV